MPQLIAPGVVRLRPLLDQYSQRQQQLISCLSGMIYVLSALTFVGTTFVYNPENLVGDTLISSPVNTVIQSTYDLGCIGLSAYASAASGFNEEGSSRPPAVQLAADGAVSVTFEENTSFVEDVADFVVRLTREDGTPIVQETIHTGVNIRYNVTFPFFASRESGIRRLNISLLFAPITPVFLSGDPDECAEFFSATALADFDPDCFDVIDTSEGFAFSTSCRVAFATQSTSYSTLINLPLTRRYNVRIQILNTESVRNAMQNAFCGSTGDFSLLRVAPFSCQVASFRDWLEVLALSFSNAGLAYALLVTLVSFIVHSGGSLSSDGKHTMPPRL